MLTSTKANSRNESRNVFSKMAKSNPFPSAIGGSKVRVAMPPSPSDTTPLVDACPMADWAVPTEA